MRALAQSLFLVLAGVLLLISPRAQAQGPVHTKVSLVTMGSGDHLFTRGGHAALLVEHYRGEELLDDAVYNFGDADWEDSSIALRFIQGNLKFRLDVPGGLMDVATDYGVHQNRDLFTQELALTPVQAAVLEAKLRALDSEQTRWYDHHYVKSICTTKIRDLLDELLDDAIAKQLGEESDGRSIRSHQTQAFDGKPLAGLGADLLLGRDNDRVLTRYEALFVPDRMREYLPEVQVPGDSGAGTRPLAGPPVQVAGRQGPSPTQTQTFGSWWFVIAALCLLALAAPRVHRPEAMARWLLGPAVSLSLIALLLGFVCGTTSVHGFQVNELLLSFLPFDIYLIVASLHLRAGSTSHLPTLRRFSHARLALAGLVLAAHAFGLLIQRPLALPLFVFAFFGQLSWLLSRSKGWSGSSSGNLGAGQS
jgi:hypothetical protein